ncbi:MAG: diguanylate cyclase [Alphaproteobacteria bacterium]|nr:diguanylate cyclase [Alphaproteobacteria bacterium]MBU1513546.1 diguanylate cyclase [Alphaproteobacteria bacterium]MBU2094809.1 diguanylate cyclase [Alphaproteobacteria bacterium]MBU2151066.1 diguanylate cyclase [Alphaproteobacteria bacterium]MBU2309349.1 diguanylate cyclase [Alphaproteobacteria bacterium]
MSSDIDAILRSPKAYLWAGKAIEAMEAHRVWPTALNFELWLHYVAAKDSEVAAQINTVLQSGAPFTDQVGEQIAAQHLPASKLSGEILDAGKSLSQELDSVHRAIESARETSEAYGQQLATASQSLEEQDPDAVRLMVENLSVATRKVREENQALESQLADTTDELGRLREHLEQVRRDAMTDALTNLSNRKAFDEAMERTCAQAAARGGPATLAVVDIDHFKVFNDTWGHQTGDQVIRYVASVIGRVAEGARFSARYGGEEFAVIFPTEKSHVALAALESAREEISSRILKRRSTNEDLGAITISTGIAEYKPGDTPAALMERADGALYASKRTGRNRTTLADEGSETTRAA